MKLSIKQSAIFASILSMLAIFVSCAKESDDEDYRYMFGLTSAIDSNYKEIEAIETTYCDAFNKAGLKFDSQFFAPNTSESAILNACYEAEDAILVSSIKFDGKYVYEIKYRGNSIYLKSFGTR